MAKKIEIQEIATLRKDIDIFAGWAMRLENPDPVILSQGGGLGMKLYDEVLRDAHAGAVIQSRILAVTGREWEIVPPDDAGNGMDDICDFLKKTLLNTNFDQARQEMLQAVVYGFYPAEVLWQKTDAAWTIDCIIPKHPRRFVFTPDRELRLLTPQNMIDGEPVPERKFIPFTYGTTDNPYGAGLGQSLWWMVWFKKNGVKFWLNFLEKFATPTTVGKYPLGTDAATQQKLLDAIDAIQTDTGIIIPDGMVVELLEASRTGQASYQGLVDYMDRAISKRVLGQTLTTEVKGEGSYAASQTHDGVRLEVVKADADYLCEALNKTMIQWLVDVNFGPQKEYPKIWIRVEEEADLKPLAERDKLLFDMGVPFPKSYFYEAYGIPEPEGDAGTLSNADQTSQIVTGDDRQRQAFSEQTTAGQFPDQAAIDAISDPNPESMTTSLQPVLSLIRQGYSYQEVEEKLLETYPNMNFREVEQLMERAIFVSEVWGRLNA